MVLLLNPKIFRQIDLGSLFECSFCLARLCAAPCRSLSINHNLTYTLWV
jgi:hypothetical protein